ncbi:RNA polymerase sigma factor [Actinoplanes sp. CA-030573]|uniref:RNA polymerase sigma factor n=1 Tax=Actinoplanes sp. CA-030573 TaxID=3239898 RepID=UPI003D89D3B2
MSDTADITRAGDGELWRRAGQGEAACFGVLFDRHGEAVRAFCARRTGSLDAADDLVSIVFLEAWRRRADVELVDDNALPWLYGIARRTMQHRWRTALRHRRALDRLPPPPPAPDHADEVAARLDDERHLTRLAAALERLRPADRDVLVLCVWQGLTYADAAVALGVPVGTVRSRLSRARSRLEAETEAPRPVPASAPRSELP